MFCPRCKSEYRLGFIRCSDCNAELVDHLPPEDQSPVDSPNPSLADFVVVTTAHDSIEEGQICSFLQANGIPAQPAPSAGRRAYPGMGMTFTEILVPEDLADTAIELLEEADRGRFRIEGADT
jgi:hypothetical protein